MGIIQTVQALFGNKVKIVYGNSSLPSVEHLTPRELYESQSNLYSVVSFLSSSIAQLPIKVFERKDGDIRSRDRNSTASALLFKPNSDQTQAEFIKALCTEYLLYGEAIVWLLPDASDSGWQMRLIPSEWIIKRSYKTNFAASSYEVKSANGTILEIDAANIIDFREYAPGMPASSLSPVCALKQTLSEQIQADRFRTTIWQNSGRFNATITRPANVAPWSETARESWVNAFRKSWSGAGSKSGSIPILEDGMTLNTYQFNSKEAQFIESKQLSREDVAAAYHVNPSLIWHTTTQTYASSKDNARALYTECLGPLLQIFQQRFNTFLLPKLGINYNKFYVEFDLSEKLKGSFEERASIIQSAVGGPWLTRDEARIMDNREPLPNGNGSEVIVPLNVLVGGQASPQDSVADAYKSVFDNSDKLASNIDFKKVITVEPKIIKLNTTPTEDEVSSIEDILVKFFKRQEKSVISKIGAKSAINNEWWNRDRWNKELSSDLYNTIFAMSSSNGKSVAEKLNSEYVEKITENYLQVYVEKQAELINDITFDKINYVESNSDQLLSEENTSTSPKTVSDVYTNRTSTETTILALSLAYFAYKFSTKESLKQATSQGKMSNVKVYKTWITGSNPRSTHAIMNNQKVPIESRFLNGSDWVHDSILGPGGTCNCNCSIEVTIEN